MWVVIVAGSISTDAARLITPGMTSIQVAETLGRASDSRYHNYHRDRWPPVVDVECWRVSDGNLMVGYDENGIVADTWVAKVGFVKWQIRLLLWRLGFL